MGISTAIRILLSLGEMYGLLAQPISGNSRLGRRWETRDQKVPAVAMHRTHQSELSMRAVESWEVLSVIAVESWVLTPNCRPVVL